MNLPASLRRPVVALLLIAASLAACGGERASAPERNGARVQTTATAPPRAAKLGPLAANAADTDRIVGEGEGALKQRLAKLEGHPVVVNQWASWCPPCAVELPFFAQAAGTYRDRVAFVGLDFRDDRASAESFLRDQSSGFPSVFDPDGDATRSLGGGRATPSTFFLGPDGEVTHTKLGGYSNYGQLEADIRRHALGDT